MSDQRVFTDEMAQHFAERIREKARQLYGVDPVWVRSEHRAGGLPFTRRQLAVVQDGKVVAVARCNRAGAVRWHEPWTTEHFVPEEPGDHSRQTPGLRN